MITVQFTLDRGGSMTWAQDFVKLDVDALALAIANKRTFIRGAIWCEDGIIYAGISKVGTYTVTP